MAKWWGLPGLRISVRAPHSSFIFGAGHQPNDSALNCFGAQSRAFEGTAEGQAVGDCYCPFGRGDETVRADGR